MSIITDKIVINMMKDTLDKVRVPLIVFAHEKAKAKPGLSMAKQVSIALFNGMKYNRVGMYSNLATKLIHAMSLAEDRETKNNLFVDAAFAHVGTILVIDMIKTGFMPAAIEEKLNTLKKNFKKMPWNQRFNRHETEKPHDDALWDEETQSETNDVCDRMARIILNNTNGYTFDKMGVEFDADVMLAHRDDLPNNISKGTLNNLWFTRLNLANFAEDDKAVIKAVREGKEIGPKDLMKFFWQNYASLSRTMSVDTSAEKRIAQCKAYLDMARACIMELPKSSTRWATYTEEQQRLGIVNVFLRDAFELSSHGNGIDNLKKGSYAYFVLSVFAEDILRRDMIGLARREARALQLELARAEQQSRTRRPIRRHMAVPAPRQQRAGLGHVFDRHPVRHAVLAFEEENLLGRDRHLRREPTRLGVERFDGVEENHRRTVRQQVLEGPRHDGSA